MSGEFPPRRGYQDFLRNRAPIPRPAPEVVRFDSLEAAIGAYRNAWETGVLTPDLVDATWGKFWEVKGHALGEPLVVPPCDRTAEELQELQAQNREVILMPDRLTEHDGLSLLHKMFPEIGPQVLSKTIRNTASALEGGGCIDVEMDSESPNEDSATLSPRDLKKTVSNLGKNGQRLSVYVVASQFNYLLTGKYFDEGASYVTLFGSRYQGSVVRVSTGGTYFPDSVISCAEGYSPRGCYRTEGRKPA